MSALAQAALSPAERGMLDRFVAAAKERLGDELISVWLFASRARGEATGALSDVDVLVVTRKGHEDRDGLWYLASQLAEVQEVDRDKIVLYGSP